MRYPAAITNTQFIIQQFAHVHSVQVVLVQVCTRRLEVTSTLSVYGASINHTTGTTLFAKRLIEQMLFQSSGTPSGSELLGRRTRCGATAQGLSRAFGQLQRSTIHGSLGLY